MSDIASVIAHLLQQRSAIDNALEALRGIGEGTPAKKRGRPKGAKATKKGAMSAEGRQRQIEAMRRYWAAKKAGAKKAAKKKRA